MTNLNDILIYLLSEDISEAEMTSFNPLTRLILDYVDSVVEVEEAVEEDNAEKLTTLVKKYVDLHIPFEELQNAAGADVKTHSQFNQKIDNAIQGAVRALTSGIELNEGVEEEKGYSGPKKYKKVVGSGKNKKTVRYGAKGYSIAPGTSKGDSYCARSYGQMKDHPSAAKDPNSPLRLSRKKWKCSGKRSRRD
jgi:hypothetical protein